MYGTLITNWYYYNNMNKTCHRCGTTDLGWNQAYHQATGKWKLENHKECSKKLVFSYQNILLKIAYHFKKFYFLSISALFGSVIAPCAADPTKNAYLASAPDV